MRSEGAKAGDSTSILLPDSRPFFTGILMAVVSLISFITQNVVWASSARIADLGKVAALLFADLINRALATRFSGRGCGLSTLITTPWVCES